MRNPTARQLAMRDPALGALMGAIGGRGADFGVDYGDDDDVGFGFGDDDDMGAVSPRSHRVKAHHQRRHHHTQKRTLLLDPNKYSDTAIERYTFSLNQPLVLGTPLGFEVSDQPDTKLRPQRVIMNAPQPAFVTVSEIKVANVSVTVGNSEDAFTYSALAQGVVLDMPTLSPSNKARISAAYTGYIPPGFVLGFAFPFVVTLQGPSTLAAG